VANGGGKPGVDAVLTALPQAGVAGALVVVIALLLRANHADRQQYSDLRSTHDAEHDEDLSNCRKENRELHATVDDLRRKLWHAEDLAAEYRRRLGITADEPDRTAGRPGSD
jgi:hypothetical protein